MTKEFFGAAAVAVGIVAYVLYVTKIVRGGTRPHAFSWLVWTAILGTAFGVQVAEGAGPGAWATGFGVVACLTIFFFTLSKGVRDFSAFDWASLVLAATAFALWRIADEPIAAAIFVTVADSLGYLPTIKKAFRWPAEENLGAFSIWTLGNLLTILALNRYSLATWLYPASGVAMNIVLISIIIYRRSRVSSGR